MEFEEGGDYFLHDVVLNAYIDMTPAAESYFVVNFPWIYDFEEYPFETITCSLHTYELQYTETVVVPILLMLSVKF